MVLEGSDYHNLWFCRPAIEGIVWIYINPLNPTALELGTKSHPYRFMNLGTLEALISHNKISTYQLIINIVENTVHEIMR